MPDAIAIARDALTQERAALQGRLSAVEQALAALGGAGRRRGRQPGRVDRDFL